jgi:toxin CptA
MYATELSFESHAEGKRMSHYNVKPIRLDFKPSYRLVAILFVATLFVSAVLVFLSIPVWIKAIAIVLVVSASLYHGLDALRRLPRSCRTLSMNSKGEWYLELNDGSVQEAVILPSSFVAPYLTVMNCSLTGRWLQYHIVILPDALDAESFRRLRVWLRWGYQASEAETPDA